MRGTRIKEWSAPARPCAAHPVRATRRAAWLAVLAPAFAGCVIAGRDYVRPEMPVPAGWHAKLEAGLSAELITPAEMARWWTMFDDPTLSTLVERALAANLELREARARVREARARRGVAAAGLFPVADTSTSFRHNRSSEETADGRSRESVDTGVDASWEVDVFGGTRRAIEAAEAELEAAQEDLRDVLVTLIAEVALNYVDLRAYQARFAVAESNLQVQAETYEMTRWRREAGLTTQLDVEQARSNLEDTRARIPGLRAGMERASNRLAILLGEPPGAIHAELQARRPIPIAPLEVVVGLPVDTLRQRPDVRRAERELAAQTARVGVAAAELYPKLSLPGSIGLEALSVSRLFSAGSRTYAIGPTVTWRVFDAGAIRRNIEVQSALQEQALIRYEAAILNALEEVENALAAYAEEHFRRRSLAEAVDAAQRAADLARDQYVSGLVDFQVVLDAERTLLSLQDQLAASDAEIAANLIRLYKAAGGGWAVVAPVVTPSAAPEANSRS